jgi:predicted phage tail protein
MASNYWGFGMISRTVNTKEGLKAALKEKADTIIITDQDLARKVRLAKGAKKGVVIATLAAGGVIAANAWNPVGWLGAAGGTALAAGLSGAGAGVAIAAIVALTFLGTCFMVMYNDYELDTSGNGNASSTNSASAENATASNSNSGGFGFNVKLTKRKA